MGGDGPEQTNIKERGAEGPVSTIMSLGDADVEESLGIPGRRHMGQTYIKWKWTWSP